MPYREPARVPAPARWRRRLLSVGEGAALCGTYGSFLCFAAAFFSLRAFYVVDVLSCVATLVWLLQVIRRRARR
jgi:hypothetical protein